jgi:hypothetical protein
MVSNPIQHHPTPSLLYILFFYFGNGGGGGGEQERRLEGQYCSSQSGLKYQHDLLYLQSINFKHQ